MYVVCMYVFGLCLTGLIFEMYVGPTSS